MLEHKAESWYFYINYFPPTVTLLTYQTSSLTEKCVCCRAQPSMCSAHTCNYSNAVVCQFDSIGTALSLYYIHTHIHLYIHINMNCSTWTAHKLVSTFLRISSALVSSSQTFRRLKVWNRWPRSMAKTQPLGRLTDMSDNQSQFVSFTCRSVEMSPQS